MTTTTFVGAGYYADAADAPNNLYLTSQGGTTTTVYSRGVDTIDTGLSNATTVFGSTYGDVIDVESGKFTFNGATTSQQGETISGGRSSDTIYAGGHGGVYTAGSGGHSELVASAGNTAILTAGGNGDALYASSYGSQDTLRAGSAQGTISLVAGTGNCTLQGGGSGSTSLEYGSSVTSAQHNAHPLTDGTDTFNVFGGGVDEVVNYRPGIDHIALGTTHMTAEISGGWGTTFSLSDGSSVTVFGVAPAQIG